MDGLVGADQRATGSAALQGAWWAVGVRDWAEIQEGQVGDLYADVLARCGVGAGTRLLDVGCGAGLFCRLARDRGAAVSGLDAAEPLLEVARRRVPDGRFTAGEMEALPYPEASFDVVTGMNSFHYAAEPARALAEAGRVCLPGGAVVVATWGPPNRCDAAGYLAALGELLPPTPTGSGGGPFAFAADGVLVRLARRAGLVPGPVRDVRCTWVYRDREDAVRGLLAGGQSSTRAIESVGRDRAAAVVTEAIAPYRTAAGGYRLDNVFRYLTATTPGGPCR